MPCIRRKRGNIVYDPISGGYYVPTKEQFDNEGKYRFESTYYIRYNARRALYALGKLEEQVGEDSPDVFICHVYLDLLLDASGMVRKRFITEGNLSDERYQQYTNNRKEYEFSDDTFPVLAAIHKMRDSMEHIDERDDRLIEGDSFYGTFNVVHADMDQEMVDGLMDTSKSQNNLLDIDGMTYTTFVRKGGKLVRDSTSRIELKAELTRILERAERIWSYVTMNDWF